MEVELRSALFSMLNFLKVERVSKTVARIRYEIGVSLGTLTWYLNHKGYRVYQVRDYLLVKKEEHASNQAQYTAPGLSRPLGC